MRGWQTEPNTSLPQFPSMEPSLCGSRRFREPRAHDQPIDGLLTELLTDNLTLTLIRRFGFQRGVRPLRRVQLGLPA